MNRWRWLVPTALLLGLAAAAMFLLRPESAAKPVVINDTPVPPVPTLDAARIARGAGLYAKNCAACHGTELRGAPDWKRPLPDGSLSPPPHDDGGHTWHHPDSLLLEIIANGGDSVNNSKMPAFGGKLSPDEMRSILEFIKSKWGKDSREFQWWITATTSGQ